MSKKLTKQEFITRAISIHGNLYDYCKSNYINFHTKTEIICKEHGSFFQIPNAHISMRRGCPKCGGTKLSNSNDFILKSTKIHGHKFDYSKVRYKNSHSNVIIICKEHGSFFQIAYHHLNGRGCPKCGGTGKLTTKEFIEKSTTLHHNKFDYSKVQYKNSKTKVEIICPQHGKFEQIPNDHLCGKGCSNCTYRISKPEIEFLNYNNIPMDCRQKRMIPYIVDGYDPKTNTVYEFLGDYWHGNLARFNPNKIHPKRKITYKILNRETFNKFDKLKQLGVKIKYIWELDWRNFKKGFIKSPLILEY